MVLWRHLSTYKTFLNTIHFLQIPLTHWDIIFIPRVSHMQKGMREYLLIKLYGLPSLYFSTPNPNILKEHPFEVITTIIVRTEVEEEGSPTPSPPSTPTPSTSNSSYASYIFTVDT